MTRPEFLARYEAELIRSYGWARENPGKLELFMSSVHVTLTDAATTWNHKGSAVDDTWKTIGGKDHPTLKALRALPV